MLLTLHAAISCLPKWRQGKENQHYGKSYYFVGIKGTGMAALARVLHDRGYHVEGSDIEKKPLRRRLWNRPVFRFTTLTQQISSQG